jgi:hypothetical protein
VAQRDHELVGPEKPIVRIWSVDVRSDRGMKDPPVASGALIVQASVHTALKAREARERPPATAH